MSEDNDPYRLFTGKKVLVKDKSGEVFKGKLVQKTYDYIALENGEGIMVVSRKDGNITSIRTELS